MHINFVCQPKVTSYQVAKAKKQGERWGIFKTSQKKKTNVELICLCDSSMSVIFMKNLDPQIYTLKPPNSVCVLLLSLLLLFIISLLSFGAKEIENKNRIRNYQVVIELHK